MLLSASLPFYYRSFDSALNSPMSAKRRHQIILMMKGREFFPPGGPVICIHSFPQGPKPAEREVYSLSLLLFKQVPNSNPCLGQGTISGGQSCPSLSPLCGPCHKWKDSLNSPWGTWSRDPRAVARMRKVKAAMKNFIFPVAGRAGLRTPGFLLSDYLGSQLYPHIYKRGGSGSHRAETQSAVLWLYNR